MIALTASFARALLLALAAIVTLDAHAQTGPQPTLPTTRLTAGMLSAAGLTIAEAVALPDHHRFDDDPFRGTAADIVLITEKDAVKCAANPALANDARLYVVPLEAKLDEALVDLIETRIKPPRHP